MKRVGYFLVLSCVITGCGIISPRKPDVTYVTKVVEASPPPGVVRYCWEEPMVQLEKNGPGLDVEGKWYHPSYIAVREVRNGKWRPCTPVPSEGLGAQTVDN